MRSEYFASRYRATNGYEKIPGSENLSDAKLGGGMCSPRGLAKGFFVFMMLHGAVCRAADLDVTGKYVSVGPYNTDMVVEKNLGLFRITLDGGVGKTAGENVSADCEAVAEGQLSGDTIHARLIPFEGNTTALSAKDIARMNPEVLVKFDKGMAVVTGTFSYCGMGNDMTGKFRKAQAEEQESAGLAAADKNLNEVYRQILAKLPSDGRAKLRKAQRAWVAFRDLDCSWVSEAKNLDCVKDRTNKRAKELRETRFNDAMGEHGLIDTGEMK